MSGDSQPNAAALEPVPFQALEPGEPDPAIGYLLAGEYRIERLLGEGGMGRVYQARQNKDAREVAVKVLTNTLAVNRASERFLREARSTASIDHPNILEIYDFGQTPDGVVYIVMEYLRGEDLADMLARETRLPWQRAMRVVSQVCAALGAAHDEGIIHRDVKPENIFRTRKARNVDFIKVLDFGIAKLVRPQPTDQRLTRTGSVFGTPAYMSPEQARGRPIDHRTDIYAVGVILYELIAGRVPYDGSEFLEIAMQHLHKPVVGPSSVMPPGSLPPAVDQIVVRAMAKDPEQRFASMGAFAEAVQAVLMGDAGGTVLTTGPVPVVKGATLLADDLPAVNRRRTIVSGTAEVATAEFSSPRLKSETKRAPAWIAVVAVVALGGVAAIAASAGLFSGGEATGADPVAALESGTSPAPSELPAASASGAPPLPTTAPQDIATRAGTGLGGTGADSEAASGDGSGDGSGSEGGDALGDSVASEPVAPPGGKPKAPRPKTGGGRLSSAQISKVLKSHKPALSFCRGGLTGGGSVRVKASFVVDGATGKPTSVVITGGGTGVKACVRSTLQGSRFPKFGAKQHRFSRKITL